MSQRCDPYERYNMNFTTDLFLIGILPWFVIVYRLSGKAYSLQLYYDFSGYSDMAVGIGQLLGFDIRVYVIHRQFYYPDIIDEISPDYYLEEYVERYSRDILQVISK